MYSFKLLQKGEIILKQYCKNRSHLFKVKDKKRGDFIVRASNKNWFNHLFGLGTMIIVGRDEETNNFYVFLNSNIVYELNINELTELINFFDNIRDKKEEKIDLRLFKD